MKETECGVVHGTIEEAIEHAYQSLGDRRLLSEPYWGTRGGNIANAGKVMGWATPDGRKRWRLDFDPAKGVHINEEDSSVRPTRKTVHRILASPLRAGTYWNKWTSRYDKPPHVLDAEADILRRKREGFS